MKKSVIPTAAPAPENSVTALPDHPDAPAPDPRRIARTLPAGGRDTVSGEAPCGGIPSLKPVSLYFHIPFCVSRCRYCAFCSTADPALRAPFAEAAAGSLRPAPLDGCRAETVYFGGGTPTVLGTDLIRILDAVRDRLPVAPDAEITVEANPGTVTPSLLRELRAAGWNRISFGLEAATDAELRFLGRRHTVAEGEAALRMAEKAGFENLSADFLLGIPGRGPEDAAALARYALSLGLPHLSSYLLRVEPGTPFDRDGVAASLPADDVAADCYLAFYGVLEAAGYRHYEISNAALPGFESRHNTGCWRLAPYLGFGPSAASFFEGRRFHFAPDIPRFLSGGNTPAAAVPDGPGGTLEEAVVLGLRLADGITPETLRPYGAPFSALLRNAAPFQASGLLRASPERICLTDAGFLVENALDSALLEGFPPEFLAFSPFFRYSDGGKSL